MHAFYKVQKMSHHVHYANTCKQFGDSLSLFEGWQFNHEMVWHQRYKTTSSITIFDVNLQQY